MFWKPSNCSISMETQRGKRILSGQSLWSRWHLLQMPSPWTKKMRTWVNSSPYILPSFPDQQHASCPPVPRQKEAIWNFSTIYTNSWDSASIEGPKHMFVTSLYSVALLSNWDDKFHFCNITLLGLLGIFSQTHHWRKVIKPKNVKEN